MCVFVCGLLFEAVWFVYFVCVWCLCERFVCNVCGLFASDCAMPYRLLLCVFVWLCAFETRLRVVCDVL